jgi:hypothetical protein
VVFSGVWCKQGSLRLSGTNFEEFHLEIRDMNLFNEFSMTESEGSETATEKSSANETNSSGAFGKSAMKKLESWNSDVTSFPLPPPLLEAIMT